MSDDEFELVRGSENVFRDFGEPSAELLQLKAILAGKIISVLDQQHISVRQAYDLTGLRRPTSRGCAKPSCNASPLTVSWRCSAGWGRRWTLKFPCGPGWQRMPRGQRESG
jgi:hypothetical protein